MMDSYTELQFQHTAARRRLPAVTNDLITLADVSTHSRAEAAANGSHYVAMKPICVSTHSRAEAAAMEVVNLTAQGLLFQHTAARRRLPRLNERYMLTKRCFNTQPRGGGCLS